MAYACFLLRYDASTFGVALSILRCGACVRVRSVPLQSQRADADFCNPQEHFIWNDSHYYPSVAVIQWAPGQSEGQHRQVVHMG